MTNDVHLGRYAAHLDTPFVVFLIGMRINHWWAVHKWLPVFLAMPRMIADLSRHPEKGLLGGRSRWGGRHFEVIQYWRSFDHLEAFARDTKGTHWPAWKAFYKAGYDNKAVGIWHETYIIGDGQYETVYGNMTRHGLAMAGEHVNLTGDTRRAKYRLKGVKDEQRQDPA